MSPTSSDGATDFLVLATRAPCQRPASAARRSVIGRARPRRLFGAALGPRAIALARRPVVHAVAPRRCPALTVAPPPAESAGVQRLFPALLVALAGLVSPAGPAFAEVAPGALAPSPAPAQLAQ